MKTSFLLPMMFIFSVGVLRTTLIFADNFISIEEAVKKGIVKVNVRGKGGHIGEVIKLKIRNLKKHPVSFSVEAGRRLDSNDSTKQDILITKAVTITLLADEEKTYSISGMCCQAHHSSPDTSSIFSIGKLADTNLVKMARFIDQNKWYNNSIAQSAVWILSDNNPMEDIGGEDAVSKKLQAFISKLTGRTMPKYKIDYAQSNNGVAYYNHPAKISGTFEYDIFTNGIVSFGIYDAEGHVVEMFFNDIPRDKGH